MFHGKVEICGINTSDLENISKEKNQELLEKTKNGDEAAREELIKGNLRLVLSIIQRFSGRQENIDDLFQIGCIGLIKAIDNFNTDLDVQFSTYAVPMIIGEVKRYLRDNNSIRVTRSMRDLAYRALSAKELLTSASSCEPSLEQIVKKLNDDGIECDIKDVATALEAIIEPVSLFDPVYSSDGSSESLYLMDQLCDESYCDEIWIENLALSDAIKKLSAREKNIIMRRFYDQKTQVEVADEIGLSQAQVSRLEKNALEKIKRNI